MPQPIFVNDQGTSLATPPTPNTIATAFIRLEDGTVTTFNYPGSKQTIPTSINNNNVITGYYSQGLRDIRFHPRTLTRHYNRQP